MPDVTSVSRNQPQPQPQPQPPRQMKPRPSDPAVANTASKQSPPHAAMPSVPAQTPTPPLTSTPALSPNIQVKPATATATATVATTTDNAVVIERQQAAILTPPAAGNSAPAQPSKSQPTQKNGHSPSANPPSKEPINPKRSPVPGTTDDRDSTKTSTDVLEKPEAEKPAEEPVDAPAKPATEKTTEGSAAPASEVKPEGEQMPKADARSSKESAEAGPAKAPDAPAETKTEKPTEAPAKEPVDTPAKPAAAKTSEKPAAPAPEVKLEGEQKPKVDAKTSEEPAAPAPEVKPEGEQMPEAAEKPAEAAKTAPAKPDDVRAEAETEEPSEAPDASLEATSLQDLWYLLAALMKGTEAETLFTSMFMSGAQNFGCGPLLQNKIRNQQGLTDIYPTVAARIFGLEVGALGGKKASFFNVVTTGLKLEGIRFLGRPFTSALTGTVLKGPYAFLLDFNATHLTNPIIRMSTNGFVNPIVLAWAEQFQVNLINGRGLKECFNTKGITSSPVSSVAREAIFGEAYGTFPEIIQSWWTRNGLDKSLPMFPYVAGSYIAGGAVGGVLSNPFDVFKTRHQTSPSVTQWEMYRSLFIDPVVRAANESGVLPTSTDYAKNFFDVGMRGAISRAGFAGAAVFLFRQSSDMAKKAFDIPDRYNSEVTEWSIEQSNEEEHDALVDAAHSNLTGNVLENSHDAPENVLPGQTIDPDPSVEAEQQSMVPAELLRILDSLGEVHLQHWKMLTASWPLSKHAFSQPSPPCEGTSKTGLFGSQRIATPLEETKPFFGPENDPRLRSHCVAVGGFGPKQPHAGQTFEAGTGAGAGTGEIPTPVATSSNTHSKGLFSDLHSRVFGSDSLVMSIEDLIN